MDVREYTRNRQSQNIHGVNRVVHHVAKVYNKETKKVETGYVTEELQVTQHDIFRHGKRNFWRGACLG